MQELQKTVPSESNKLSVKQYGSTALSKLPEETTLTHIAGLLHGLALLYQVPNWTTENAARGAVWILHEYPHEQLQTVTMALQNPPPTEEKVWRITPDVIREWVEIQRTKEVNARLRVEQEKHDREVAQQLKQPSADLSEGTKQMIETMQKNFSAQEPTPLKSDRNYFKTQAVDKFSELYQVSKSEMGVWYDEWENEQSGQKEPLTFQEWLLK